jgi:hypothetical protein
MPLEQMLKWILLKINYARNEYSLKYRKIDQNTTRTNIVLTNVVRANVVEQMFFQTIAVRIWCF